VSLDMMHKKKVGFPLKRGGGIKLGRAIKRTKKIGKKKSLAAPEEGARGIQNLMKGPQKLIGNRTISRQNGVWKKKKPG